MNLFIRFLFDFLGVFFNGILKIIGGIIDMFNFPKYIEVLKDYASEFNMSLWLLACIAILFIVLLFGAVIFLVYLLLKKYIRVRKSLVEQEQLLEEVADLNKEVLKLTTEKDKILAMKVSQLGLKPGISPVEEIKQTVEETTEEKAEAKEVPKSDEEKITSRFYRLTQIDRKYANYKQKETNNTIDLPGIIQQFRYFAASRMRLFYKEEIIRLFFSSLGSTRLIILQGISGTGKTSLPYAMGKFLENDAVIASVQPSWRDRTELFGYFNEFTKKFNETEVLAKMYEAKYIDQVYLTILDEMNIARVEYYFAEMLSILEMPSRSEWVIELVPNVWPDDPKLLNEGKILLPDNMWYIGTINNDDSTFMVTDKVYDRAIPIDINDKGQPFECPLTDNLSLSSKYLESLFDAAKQKYKVSDDNMAKLEQMDNYVIEHFRMAFGNRIVKQLKEFVPVYMACGGTEIDGIDFIVCHKILRKFEQLNLSFIRDEIDGFVKFLDNLYGKDNFKDSKSYLLRLKKLV